MPCCGEPWALPTLAVRDKTTNHRCPPPVVERAVRLVEHNRERFAKRIRPGSSAAGTLILAPDASDEVVRIERVMAGWPDDGSTRAVLARTNQELLPALVTAVELDVPFRAPRLDLLVESPRLDPLLDALAVAARARPGAPLLVLAGAMRRDLGTGGRRDGGPGDDGVVDDGLVAAVVAWAAPYPDLAAFRAAVTDVRDRLARLRRDDAALTLATAHSTKGLELDHVLVVGMEAGRFPSRRSVKRSEDPRRALEEERGLAYVAWTRARRSLTLLYDPAAPSPFLLEAFDPDELALPATA